MGAIEALGRISTDESRAALKSLYESHRESWREYIVLTLARYGHPGDAGFFADVLTDATADLQSKRYAALGLGHVGGDQAACILNACCQLRQRSFGPRSQQRWVTRVRAWRSRSSSACMATTQPRMKSAPV